MTAFLLGGRMKLIDIINSADDEIKLEEYLIELGLLKSFKQCPFCSNDKFGVVRRNKLKCYRCKREWSKRKDSPIENLNVSGTKILLAIKLFEHGIGFERVLYELSMFRKTLKSLENIINSMGGKV